MQEHESTTTRERVIRAPRDVVWGIASDTNRFDRAAGLKPGRYEWRLVDGVRSRVASAREVGFDIEWVERPYQWVEGAHLLGERVFLKGPVSRAGYRLRLDDVEGGTLVRAEMYIVACSAVGRAVALGLRPKHKRVLDRYLGAIASQLQPSVPQLLHDDDDGPPSIRARRALASADYDPVTSGPRSESNAGELRARSQLLRQSPVDRVLVDELVELLASRPDEELSQIRPFELAGAWQANRREVLRVFLHATRAGLVDLRWQINCPVCRVAAGVAASLSEVSGSSHCEACNLSYDVDLASHVEAVFQCNPAIRKVDTRLYCASSPSFLPHVVAQVTLAPGQERREPLNLSGPIHVRTLQGHKAVDTVLHDRAAGLVVDVATDSLHVSASAEASSVPTLVLRSTASTPVTVVVERGGWSADVVLGSVIATLPEFYDLFGTEAPATGVELTVGRIALVFTDLTGSTAMYEQVGDAKAFAMVHEHFGAMGECVEANGGAIVKTMGDAVMACFPSEVEAVRAAVEMLARNYAQHGEAGLGLKVGVHAGPCLVVRANDRLDFFGTTVNIAARLQAKAGRGQVVLAYELASREGVREVLAHRPFRRFEASLKGIQEAVQLVAVTVDVGAFGTHDGDHG